MRKISKDNDDWGDTYYRLKSLKGYDHPWVRKYLNNTYLKKCPFCGGKPGATATFHIEHFYPQVDYGDLATDLHNLHYSCPKCNGLKGDKYNGKKVGGVRTDILSPNYYLDENGIWKDTTQEFLNTQLRYSGHLLFHPTDSTLGKNTIEAFNLNNEDTSSERSRGELIDARIKLLALSKRLIRDLTKNLNLLSNEGSDDVIEDCIEDLKALKEMVRADAEYSEMIVDNYGQIILKLFKVAYVLLVDCSYTFKRSLFQNLNKDQLGQLLYSMPSTRK